MNQVTWLDKLLESCTVMNRPGLYVLGPFFIKRWGVVWYFFILSDLAILWSYQFMGGIKWILGGRVSNTF